MKPLNKYAYDEIRQATEELKNLNNVGGSLLTSHTLFEKLFFLPSEWSIDGGMFYESAVKMAEEFAIQQICEGHPRETKVAGHTYDTAELVRILTPAEEVLSIAMDNLADGNIRPEMASPWCEINSQWEEIQTALRENNDADDTGEERPWTLYDICEMLDTFLADVDTYYGRGE